MIGLLLGGLGAGAVLAGGLPGRAAVSTGLADRGPGPTVTSSVRARLRRIGVIVAVAGVPGFLAGSVALAGVLLAALLGWPVGQRSLALSRANRAVVAAVPDTLEVVGMALSAGMSLPELVDLVVYCGPPAVHEAFSTVVGQLRAGESRRFALRSLAPLGRGAYLPMVDVLLTGERDGAPVALMLDRLAQEASRAHRHAAEERARRTPVLLLGPLLVCSLPAVLIGAVVPFITLTLGQTPL